MASLNHSASLDSRMFCMESSGKVNLCATVQLDEDLRTVATEPKDTSLLAKITGGDSVVIAAKYRHNCLNTYGNSYRSVRRSQEERTLEGRTFAELICYVECLVEERRFL